ncbi:hypothetical protein KDJ56_11335 [Brevibacillus composti]|uniref:Family 2 glycosyl transferase n=1 Tax=Brevibacillus composti TaxID=2796470 RepID=A0A7T5EPI5_9BACL|nr:hypothetical protein [Brevibacillus composti]QQE76414.1 hypothetical protein JD108_11390 [Brevibacillus composti]QUO43492.1 hypothetical protein KDJ56_11335 [Brevibacillus composti]
MGKTWIRRRIGWLFLTGFAGLATGYLLWGPTAAQVDAHQTEEGYSLKFRTSQTDMQVYEEGEWRPYFVKGINLGASLPGRYPGELPIAKEDYLRWFGMMHELGTRAVRIYTIHQPVFYEALVEFNRKHANDPLYLIQGIWSPEEALIEKKDAFLPEIRTEFRNEIEYAVGAVYGDITIPERSGKASGTYSANAGPYLLAWHIGTEWDPEMVKITNEKRAEEPRYQGDHFQASAEASAFESWLAEMLDLAAEQEAMRGWQHPVTFTNWVTTDPLEHPGEPMLHEDMVSVDPTHIEPIRWEAGYFAAYHVYPYYPDLFRYDVSLQNVRNQKGEVDTYKAYLRKLREHHSEMPVMVTEFGVPSSVGAAHRGLLGRDQGGHDEREQGQINADLLREIYEEGYAGAILFTWQDEWFKRTWNTMRFELPEENRAYWKNELTNESFFGLLAMDAGLENILSIDGDVEDWDKLKDNVKKHMNGTMPGIRGMWMTHDEAYVYFLLRLEQPLRPEREHVVIGIDTIPGGNREAQELPGLRLDEGLEAMIRLGDSDESEVKIASNYDFHKRLYGKRYGMLPYPDEEQRDNSGLFLPWKLAVSLEMSPPDTKTTHPLEEMTVGQLRRGTTVPGKQGYSSQANWETRGEWLELRVPWMLLGFTDPSTSRVMRYPSGEGSLTSTESEGIRVLAMLQEKAEGSIKGVRAGQIIRLTELDRYSWPVWSLPRFSERKKESFSLYQKALDSIPTYR